MDNLLNQLSRTMLYANRYLCRLMEEAGLTCIVPSHGEILVQLFRHEELTMRELAEKIDRDPSTVTTLIKKLIHAGYVQTSPCTRDKRATNVSLTAKGRELETKFREISAELAAVQNRAISAQERRDLNLALDKVQKNFKEALER